MRVLVIGIPPGQLATELFRQAPSYPLDLAPPTNVDLADRSALTQALDRLSPELILNAAAYTAVDRAETEPELARAVNADGPATLASWCSAHGAALFHVSTDYVFDGSKSGPYTEADATNPLGVYGSTKLAGEEAVRQHLPRHLILRTSWVFSAHGHNFVKTMLRLARERDVLRVVADQVGKPTSAADLARHLLSLATRLKETGSLAWGTYHLAGAGETSWHGFAEAIVSEQAAHTGRSPEVQAITTADYPTPAKRPANSVLDTRLYETTFGLAPRSWREELAQVTRELLQA